MVENNEKIAFDFLLPIGAACQTRYQIERYLRKYLGVEQPSCFFDWLGLGGVVGVQKIIELNFQLCSEDFTVKSLYRDEHYTPIHEISGFRFQHDFNSSIENRKTEELAMANLEKHMVNTLNKYHFLGERTRKILEDYSLIGLVYHGKINRDNISSLLKILEENYGSKFYVINVMNKGAEIPISLDKVISLVVDNSSIKGHPEEWKGANDSWDQVLSLLNLSQIRQFSKN